MEEVKDLIYENILMAIATDKFRSAAYIASCEYPNNHIMAISNLIMTFLALNRNWEYFTNNTLVHFMSITLDILNEFYE